MSQIPENLKYVSSHEWVSIDDNGIATVGITDHAQQQLGDVVYVELPTIGQAVAAEGHCGVVESVKAASEIYSPVSGEIVEINSELESSPELVNSEPYGAWFFKVKLNADFDQSTLLDAAAYAAEINA